MKNSLKNRQERINLLYTYYLSNWEWDLLKTTTDQLDESELETVKITLENIKKLENEINKHLKSDWKWERVGVLERAILLNAVAEIIIFNNKPDIVISEANKIVKKYISDDKASKLITGILNKIKM